MGLSSAASLGGTAHIGLPPMSLGGANPLRTTAVELGDLQNSMLDTSSRSAMPASDSKQRLGLWGQAGTDAVALPFIPGAGPGKELQGLWFTTVAVAGREEERQATNMVRCVVGGMVGTPLH